MQAGAAVRQGVIWNLLNTAFSQGAGIVIFLVLSRQLSPEIFGVFAIAALLVDLYANQGRWAAMDGLIQRQDFSKVALSSAFWSLMLFALALAGAFAVAAGGIATLVDEPLVADVLPALALAMPLMPAAAVMDALLMRDLQFKAQALRNMAGTFVGGGVGLLVAFGPAPEWALVAQRLAVSATTLVVLFALTRWLPSLTLQWTSARGFLRRAGQLWAAMLLATAHARVIEASIGVRSGVQALGLLRVAQRLEEALHGPITGPIQALWVPVLSKIREDRDAAWSLFLQLSRLAALIAIPAFVGLGLVAHDLVNLAFDERYARAADVLMLLGLAGLLIPVGYFGNMVFAALDRSDLGLKFSLVALPLTAVAVWFASPYGAAAAVGASITVMGCAGIIVTLTQIRMMGGDLRRFVAFVSPAYLAAAAMIAVLVALRQWLPVDAAVLRLACLIPAGGAAYLGWLAVAHRKAVRAAWAFISEVRAPDAADGAGAPADPASAPSTAAAE